MKDLRMSRAMDEPSDSEVSRLLAGAAKLIGSVRYCWLVTRSEAGGVSARPMGRVLPACDWKILFVTYGRSQKASDIRRADSVELIFQGDHEEAYGTFAGRAALIEDRLAVERLWKPEYEPNFPEEADRANAAFIEITVERMKLWIRGVTPEPYGLRAGILERGAGGKWCVGGARG
jgi:general stress protein 26